MDLGIVRVPSGRERRQRRRQGRGGSAVMATPGPNRGSDGTGRVHVTVTTRAPKKFRGEKPAKWLDAFLEYVNLVGYREAEYLGIVLDHIGSETKKEVRRLLAEDAVTDWRSFRRQFLRQFTPKSDRPRVKALKKVKKSTDVKTTVRRFDRTLQRLEEYGTVVEERAKTKNLARLMPRWVRSSLRTTVGIDTFTYQQVKDKCLSLAVAEGILDDSSSSDSSDSDTSDDETDSSDDSDDSGSDDESDDSSSSESSRSSKKRRGKHGRKGRGHKEKTKGKNGKKKEKKKQKRRNGHRHEAEEKNGNGTNRKTESPVETEPATDPIAALSDQFQRMSIRVVEAVQQALGSGQGRMPPVATRSTQGALAPAPMAAGPAPAAGYPTGYSPMAARLRTCLYCDSPQHDKFTCPLLRDHVAAGKVQYGERGHLFCGPEKLTIAVGRGGMVQRVYNLFPELRDGARPQAPTAATATVQAVRSRNVRISDADAGDEGDQGEVPTVDCGAIELICEDEGVKQEVMTAFARLNDAELSEQLDATEAEVRAVRRGGWDVMDLDDQEPRSQQQQNPQQQQTPQPQQPQQAQRQQPAPTVWPATNIFGQTPQQAGQTTASRREPGWRVRARPARRPGFAVEDLPQAQQPVTSGRGRGTGRGRATGGGTTGAARGRQAATAPTTSTVATTGRPAATGATTRPAAAAAAAAIQLDSSDDDAAPAPRYRWTSELMRYKDSEQETKRLLEQEVPVKLGTYLALSPEMTRALAGAIRRRREVVANVNLAVRSTTTGTTAWAPANSTDERERVYYAVAGYEAPVTLMNKTIRAVLDPGSEVNLVSERMARELGLAVDRNMRWELNVPGVAAEQRARALGVIHPIPLTIGGTTGRAALFVVREVTFDLLLGRPFEVEFAVSYVQRDGDTYAVIRRNGAETEVLVSQLVSSANTDSRRPRPQVRAVRVTAVADEQGQAKGGIDVARARGATTEIGKINDDSKDNDHDDEYYDTSEGDVSDVECAAEARGHDDDGWITAVEEDDYDGDLRDKRTKWKGKAVTKPAEYLRPPDSDESDDDLDTTRTDKREGVRTELVSDGGRGQHQESRNKDVEFWVDGTVRSAEIGLDDDGEDGESYFISPYMFSDAESSSATAATQGTGEGNSGGGDRVVTEQHPAERPERKPPPTAPLRNTQTHPSPAVHYDNAKKTEQPCPYCEDEKNGWYAEGVQVFRLLPSVVGGARRRRKLKVRLRKPDPQAGEPSFAGKTDLLRWASVIEQVTDDDDDETGETTEHPSSEEEPGGPKDELESTNTKSTDADDDEVEEKQKRRRRPKTANRRKERAIWREVRRRVKAAHITIPTPAELKKIRQKARQEGRRKPKPRHVYVGGGGEEQPDADDEKEIEEATKTFLEFIAKRDAQPNRWTEDRLSKVESGILNPAERDLLLSILKRRDKAFAWHDKERGFIDPRRFPPIRLSTCPHRVWSHAEPQFSSADIKEVIELLRNKLESKMLEPSRSCYSSTWFCIRKPSGSLRFIQDLRPLNACTPLLQNKPPNIRSVIERTAGRKCITTLDQFSGYDSLLLASKSRPLTALKTPLGLMHLRSLPQGYVNSVQLYQEAMRVTFRDIMLDEDLDIYVDDFYLLSILAEEADDNDKDEMGRRRYIVKHLDLLDKVLERACDAGLVFSGAKMKVGQRETRILGYAVGELGWRPLVSAVAALRGYPSPTDVPELRAFMGLAQFYAPFIPRMATITRPLYRLLKKGVRWAWTRECERCMRHLCTTIMARPILQPVRYRDWNKRPLEFWVDASQQALGCVLMQRGEDGRRHPVAFRSIPVTGARVNYGSTKLETLALYDTLKTYGHLVRGRRFKVYTDNTGLEGLANGETLTTTDKTLIRWMTYIRGYVFTAHYVPGPQNPVADALSRIKITSDDPTEPWRSLGEVGDIEEMWDVGGDDDDAEWSDDDYEVDLPPKRQEAWEAVTSAVAEARAKKEAKDTRPVWTSRTPAVFATRAEVDDYSWEPQMLVSRDRGVQTESLPERVEYHGEATTQTEGGLGQVERGTQAVPEKAEKSVQEAPTTTSTEVQVTATTREADVQTDVEKGDSDEEIKEETVQALADDRGQQEWIRRFIDMDKPYPAPTKISTDDTYFNPGHYDRAFWRHLGLHLATKGKKYRSRRVVKAAPRFFLRHGYLWRYEKQDGVAMRARRVLGSVREAVEVIDDLHRAAGHRGRDATFGLSQQLYYHRHLYIICEAVTKGCEACQRHARPREREPFRTARVPRTVFEQIHADVQYMPKSSEGHKYILTLRCGLSGYTVLYPLRKRKARAVIDRMKRFVQMFGPPTVIVSDRGEFRYDAVSKFLGDMGVSVTPTTTYHPQGNAPIERSHQTTRDSLLKCCGGEDVESQAEWHKHVWSMQHAINTVKSRMTGASAYELVFGQESRLPTAAAVPMDEAFDGYVPGTGLTWTTDKLLSARARALEQKATEIPKVREKLYAERLAAIRQANRRRRIRGVRLAKGDLVLRYNARDEVHGKLPYVRWNGPYKICQVFENGTYAIGELDSDGPFTTAHGDKLQRYRDFTIPIAALEAEAAEDAAARAEREETEEVA